jgi:hypothetical protein
MTNQFTLQNSGPTTLPAAVSIDGATMTQDVPGFRVDFMDINGIPLTVTFAKPIDPGMFQQLLPNGTQMLISQPDPQP